MHATTQPTVALWRVRGQGRSRRCRPCVTHAAQGGEAPSSGGAPRKLTPLPADFGERNAKARPERSPYAPTPLPSDFGAQFSDSSAQKGSRPGASPFGATPATPKPGASPFGASAVGGATPASPFGVSSATTAPKPGLPKPGVPAAAPVQTASTAAQGSAAAQSGGGGGFKPTTAQVIIAVSFTTITALMLTTFYVVLNAGGIHFNT